MTQAVGGVTDLASDTPPTARVVDTRTIEAALAQAAHLSAAGGHTGPVAAEGILSTLDLGAGIGHTRIGAADLARGAPQVATRCRNTGAQVAAAGAGHLIARIDTASRRCITLCARRAGHSGACVGVAVVSARVHLLTGRHTAALTAGVTSLDTLPGETQEANRTACVFVDSALTGVIQPIA